MRSQSGKGFISIYPRATAKPMIIALCPRIMAPQVDHQHADHACLLGHKKVIASLSHRGYFHLQSAIEPAVLERDRNGLEISADACR